MRAVEDVLRYAGAGGTVSLLQGVVVDQNAGRGNKLVDFCNEVVLGRS